MTQDASVITPTIPEGEPIEIVRSITYESVDRQCDKEIVRGLRMVASGVGVIISAYIRKQRLKETD